MQVLAVEKVLKTAEIAEKTSKMAQTNDVKNAFKTLKIAEKTS